MAARNTWFSAIRKNNFSCFPHSSVKRKIYNILFIIFSMPPQEQKLDPQLHQVLRQQAKLKNPASQVSQPSQQMQRQMPTQVYQEPVEDTETMQEPTEEKRSVFKRWWFWLIIALILLGIAATAAYFMFLR